MRLTVIERRKWSDVVCGIWDDGRCFFSYEVQISYQNKHRGVIFAWDNQPQRLWCFLYKQSFLRVCSWEGVSSTSFGAALTERSTLPWTTILHPHSLDKTRWLPRWDRYQLHTIPGSITKQTGKLSTRRYQVQNQTSVPTTGEYQTTSCFLRPSLWTKRTQNSWPLPQANANRTFSSMTLITKTCRWHINKPYRFHIYKAHSGWDTIRLKACFSQAIETALHISSLSLTPTPKRVPVS